MNRFQRCASNYAYYGYLNRYAPETLRNYQSERHLCLGRKGAYDTLVIKMTTDHVNFEEEMNLNYKTPTIMVNTWMRVAWFLFLVPAILIMCNHDYNLSHSYFPRIGNSGYQSYLEYYCYYPGSSPWGGS